MRKLPLAEMLVALAVLAGGVGVYVYAHRDEAAIETTKDRGDLLVAALERHRAVASRYPDSLPQLVPAHLDSIPRPAWGDAWTYQPFQDGAHAELYVRAGRLTLRYDFTGRSWALSN